MYYRARFYHPALGRFVSADTIVPGPANPQSFNRYSYVNNQPCNYNDPSGHCGAEAAASSDDSYYVGWAEYHECTGLRTQLEDILGNSVEGVWYLWQMEAFLEGARALEGQGITLTGELDADKRRAALQALVIYWWHEGVDTVEISARTVEFAHILGGDIEDLIAVLSGHVGDGLAFFEAVPSAYGPYNTFEDLESTSGFVPRYADPDPENNQVHHTWFWLQVGYYNNDAWAWIGNVKHEWLDTGRSYPDYLAGWWGIRVGDRLRDGDISLLDLANMIRTDLGGK